MNNFQLNNTSVYLGGQCKWDLVLGNKDGQIYIQGFQLTPLSDNVAFNKRGTINYLNQNHSYTIKKYCEDLKENFWSIDPCLSQKVTIKNDEDITVGEGKMDNSVIAGTKRSSCYQVYHKQFECLTPLWLEHLEDDKYLSFSFDLCSLTSQSSQPVLLDTKSFDLKPIDSTDETFEFHNKFVEYFYNWLKYLNINIGNNKVLDIDLQNSVAQIDGVSIISGQKSNPISCDYICDNLLSYERPNIETDYILTSLFKSHNIITSQLFNLCFCFDLIDIVNPFFINQLNGKTISMTCDVMVDNKSLERRSLYTNYEFVRKNIYNPYLFLDDTTLNQSAGLNILYKEKYKYNNLVVDEVNVLDYLRDYNNEDIKDLNKLSQHIIHWDYIYHNEDIFNLYQGYAGLNPYYGMWKTHYYDNIKYYIIDLFEMNRLNCIDSVYTNAVPTRTNGVLNWIYPVKIITIRDNIKQQLFDKIKLAATSAQCVLYNEGSWSIDKSIIGRNIDAPGLSKLRLSFIKCDFAEPYAANDMKHCVTVFNEWESIYNNEYDLSIFKNPNDTENDHYIIVTKNIDYFSVIKLLKIFNNIDNPSTFQTDFKTYIESINKIIKNIDTNYNFYGFNTEIEVGKDDLQKECYYKSPDKKTFVYRKCGKLTPCLKTDDGSINYLYCENVWNGSVHKINREKDKFDVEYKDYGKNKILSVLSDLIYNITKSTSDDDSLEIKIKQEIKQTYNLDDGSPLIDYIYNLYEITYTFEYASETDISNVNYKVNMILK